MNWKSMSSSIWFRIVKLIYLRIFETLEIKKRNELDMVFPSESLWYSEETNISLNVIKVYRISFLKSILKHHMSTKTVTITSNFYYRMWGCDATCLLWRCQDWRVTKAEMANFEKWPFVLNIRRKEDEQGCGQYDP